MDSSSPVSRDNVSPERKTRRKRRKVNTLVACNACRSRKLACDGARPVCARCQERRRSCDYDTPHAQETRADTMRTENQKLKARLAAYESILPDLVNVPRTQLETARFPSYRRRTVGSPPRLIGSSPSSQEENVRATPLQIRTRLEYQMWISHSTLSPCFEDANQTRSSLVPLLTPPFAPARTPTPQNIISKPVILPAIYAGPCDDAISASFCDSRLRGLDISQWTNVPITNEAAIGAITLYLTTEQPIVGFFDADLFIQDLVTHSSGFCSRFMVSGLLSWACHAYKIQDRTVPTHEFGQEAARILATQNLPYDATTVVGALFLSLSASSDGRLEIADRYKGQVLDMASTLGWFGAPTSTFGNLDGAAANRLRADSHAAWGLFNYMTMTSFCSQRRMIKSPPKFPTPGDGGIIGYEEGTNKAMFHHLPQYMGGTFTAACQYFLGANEITLSHLSP